MEFKLCVYAFGAFRFPREYDTINRFYETAQPIFQAAEQAPGFLDRIHSPDSARKPRLKGVGKYDDTPTTLTVWNSLQDAYDFVYRSSHKEVFGKRKQWFKEPQWPNYVLWWIPSSINATREDASRRLEHLNEYRETPYAFSFRKPFSPQGEQLHPNYKADS